MKIEQISDRTATSVKGTHPFNTVNFDSHYFELSTPTHASPSYDLYRDGVSIISISGSNSAAMTSYGVMLPIVKVSLGIMYVVCPYFDGTNYNIEVYRFSAYATYTSYTTMVGFGSTNYTRPLDVFLYDGKIVIPSAVDIGTEWDVYFPYYSATTTSAYFAQTFEINDNQVAYGGLFDGVDTWSGIAVLDPAYIPASAGKTLYFKFKFDTASAEPTEEYIVSQDNLFSSDADNWQWMWQHQETIFFFSNYKGNVYRGKYDVLNSFSRILTGGDAYGIYINANNVIIGIIKRTGTTVSFWKVFYEGAIEGYDTTIGSVSRVSSQSVRGFEYDSYYVTTEQVTYTPLRTESLTERMFESPTYKISTRETSYYQYLHLYNDDTTPFFIGHLTNIIDNVENPERVMEYGSVIKADLERKITLTLTSLSDKTMIEQVCAYGTVCLTPDGGSIVEGDSYTLVMNKMSFREFARWLFFRTKKLLRWNALGVLTFNTCTVDSGVDIISTNIISAFTIQNETLKYGSVQLDGNGISVQAPIVDGGDDVLYDVYPNIDSVTELQAIADNMAEMKYNQVNKIQVAVRDTGKLDIGELVDVVYNPTDKIDADDTYIILGFEYIPFGDVTRFQLSNALFVEKVMDQNRQTNANSQAISTLQQSVIDIETSGAVAAHAATHGNGGSDEVSLDASQVTAGTFDTARIPNLSADKITSDVLADARIPNLAAGKITAGTFDDARISLSSVTQHIPTDSISMDNNKTITTNIDGASFILKSLTTGNSMAQYISYVDSAGTQRSYIGYGSGSNSDLYVHNSIGDIRLYGDNTLISTVNSLGVTVNSGDLILNRDPSSDLHAATKQYVDDNAGVSAAEAVAAVNAAGLDIANTKIIQINGDGQVLILKSATTGNAVNNYIRFQNSAAASQGYMGFGSAANTNMDIYNAVGDLRLLADDALIATLSSTGLSMATSMGIGFATGAVVNVINTSFTDNDTSLMTSQAIKEKIEAYGYTTNAGTVTNVTGSSPISVATGTTTPVISHLTTAGNKHIPTGGSAGQFLKYSSSGTATWDTPSYSTVTQYTDALAVSAVNAAGLNIANTKNIQINGDGQVLILKSATTGNSVNNYIRFQNSAATAQGYIGYGSGSNANMYINNEVGSLYLYGTGSLVSTISSTGLNIESGKVLTFTDGGSVNRINTTFVDNDTSLMTSQAIKEKITSYGYSTTTGTVTSVGATAPIASSGGATPTISHSTAAGYKHIPTGGAAGNFLKYSSSGTATWVTPSYYTDTNARAACVATTITNGVTTSAPNQNAVYDALALKANLASPTFTGTLTSNANIGMSAGYRFIMDYTDQATLQYPAMAIGKTNNGANHYQMIGFGYTSDNNPPVAIGYQELSNSGETSGQIVFAARNSTSNIAPSVVVWITAAGVLHANDYIEYCTELPEEDIDIANIKFNGEGWKNTFPEILKQTSSKTVVDEITKEESEVNDTGLSIGMIARLALKKVQELESKNAALESRLAAIEKELGLEWGK